MGIQVHECPREGHCNAVGKSGKRLAYPRNELRREQWWVTSKKIAKGPRLSLGFTFALSDVETPGSFGYKVS